MSVTTPANINLAIPGYKIDQIIGVHTGTLAIAAATVINGFITTSQTFGTLFSDNCYYQGIYSVDNGVTWNDLGVYQPNLSTPGQPVLQTVTCQAYMIGQTLTIVGKNWYDSVHNTSSAYTILYKIVLIAKNTQGSLIPLASTQTIFYRSSVNMQKIFLANSFAASTSITTIVAHNLGYIPKVRAWFTNTNSTGGFDGIFTLPAGSLATLDWYSTNVQIDTNNVAFAPLADSSSFPSGIAGNEEYRIYLDS